MEDSEQNHTDANISVTDLDDQAREILDLKTINEKLYNELENLKEALQRTQIE